MHRRRVVFAVTILLVALYASFLTADILTGDSDNPYSKIAKYICILLCFVLTLAIGKNGHDRRDTRLLQAALFLTACADFTIGILGQFIAGIGVFILVHLVYIVRHARGFTWNKKEIVSASITYGFIALVFLLLRETLSAAGLFWPALVYALILSTSLWLAIGTIWRKFYPRTLDWFIAGGMLAFFLCDVNVGLFNAFKKDGMTLFYSLLAIRGEVVGTGSSPVAVEIPYTLRSLIGILVWFFYLPAQFLLSLSGFRVSFLRSVYPLLPDLPEPE